MCNRLTELEWDWVLEVEGASPSKMDEKGLCEPRPSIQKSGSVIKLRRGLPRQAPFSFFAYRSVQLSLIISDGEIICMNRLLLAENCFLWRVAVPQESLSASIFIEK